MKEAKETTMEFKKGDFVIWEYVDRYKKEVSIASFDKVIGIELAARHLKDGDNLGWETYEVQPLLLIMGHTGETIYKFYKGRWENIRLRKATPAEIKKYTEALVLKRL